MYVRKKLFTWAMFVFFISLSVSVCAQGINFQEELSWQQVKAKAQKENKYIFVDCAATWCGPCKKMEKEVYPSKKVGDFFNDKFISVKLQMDTTQNDSKQVKSWYAIALIFRNQYKIISYPTYLYFSPEGKILNKYTGYRDEDEFVKIAQNSLNPEMQYYTLLDNYRMGKKNYATIPKLAVVARAFNDTAIASIMARDYIKNYLRTLNVEQLYTKENIIFLQNFSGTEDSYLNFLYNHRDKIDKIMEQDGYARNAIDYYIYTKDIYPVIKQSDEERKEPVWDELKTKMLKKYGGEDVDSNILRAKTAWYSYKENWDKYGIAANDMFHNHLNRLTFLDLNNYAWNAFQNITDPTLLRAAVNWSEAAINLAPKGFVPNLMDTKANLLYKLGENQEAILLEEKALVLARDQKQDGIIKQNKENIEKMKNGIPTWNKSK